MSAIGIEPLDENIYRVCRFQYKKQRDEWVARKDSRRAASDDKLDHHLKNKARSMMSPSGNECVRTKDTRMWK